MQAIHKYTLKKVPGIQHIDVRRGAKFLKLAVQHDEIVVWFEEDTHEGWRRYEFMLYHTGDRLDDLHRRCQYIDTALLNSGSYVLHVYKIN